LGNTLKLFGLSNVIALFIGLNRKILLVYGVTTILLVITGRLSFSPQYQTWVAALNKLFP
jgi:hypothetical protein